MKKVYAALLIAAIHAGAMAEWLRVGSNERTTMYADPSTIRKSGSLVKIWCLSDEVNIKDDGGGSLPYLSSKDQSEYDCKEEHQRTLYFTNHIENMGKGEVVFVSTTPLKWIPIAPGSLIEAPWKIACNK